MPPTSAEERNSRVLGKAVHPAALRRLHELFPNARVSVEHRATPVELPAGAQKLARRYYQRQRRETRVWIDLDGDRRSGGAIFGTATCHHEDNFDRRRGIELAFRRALDIARRRRESDAYRRRRESDAYRRRRESDAYKAALEERKRDDA